MPVTVVATSGARSWFHGQVERCAHGEHVRTGNVAIMAWILWLAVPVLAPALAGVVVWVRGRPVRTPDPENAMQQHQDYLTALVTPARGTIRTAPAEVRD